MDDGTKEDQEDGEEKGQALMHGDEVTTDAVALADYSGEAGQQYTVTCPACKDTVEWAPAAWWSLRCSCGYLWHVSITATGTKDTPTTALLAEDGAT